MKHIVGFSGGIDSQATALWVRNRFPKDDVILLNSNAGGHEHWMTVDFIRRYADEVFPVQVVVATLADFAEDSPGVAAKTGLPPETPLTMEMLGTLKQRFPSTKARFCTTYLKLIPQRRWMRANVRGDFCRYSGLRREEGSPNRHRRGRFYTPISEEDDFFQSELFHPIADWTKQMCFDYCRHHGEEVNPLYSLGFERVGCSPCVNASKEDIRNWATRFPDRIENVRRLEQAVGKTFFPPQTVPGQRYSFVDDVVEWSRTVDKVRNLTPGGGRQLSILADHVEPFDSKYGLCE